MTTDMEDISVTLGCDQTRSRTVVFKHSVGCDGGSVKDVVDVASADVEALAHFL